MPEAPAGHSLHDRSIPADIAELASAISRIKPSRCTRFFRAMQRSLRTLKSRDRLEALGFEAGDVTEVVSLLSSVNEQLPHFRTVPFLPCKSYRSEPRICLVAAYYLMVSAQCPSLASLRSFIKLLQARVLLSIFEHRLLRTALQLEILTLLFEFTSSHANLASPVAARLLRDALRTVSDASWNHLAASMSRFEPTLKRDPAQAYPFMDSYSKQLYRTAVGQLAMTLKVPETDLANGALALAIQANIASPPSEPHRRHIGFYLIDPDGSLLLAYWLTRSIPLKLRLALLWQKYGLLAFASGVLAISLAAAAILVRLYDDGASLAAGGDLCGLLIYFQLLFLTLIEVVGANMFPPRRPLSMDPDAQSKDKSLNVAVSVPCLIRNTDDVNRLCESLAAHAVATRDSRVSYILLSDFPDASSSSQPNDSELLNACDEAVRELNRNGPDASAFLLLHRNRTFSTKQRCWMGRERKRGKLEQLMLLLDSGANTFDHVAGDILKLQGKQFLLTLDEDSRLSDKCVQRMVAVMKHPLNHPVFAQDGQSLSRGYAILQPRITHSSRPAYTQKGFSSIPYKPRSTLNDTRPYPHFYQDFFGRSSFMGKGLLHTATVSRLLQNRIPPDRLLSHDVIESGLIRTAFVSHIAIEETQPATRNTLGLRTHRWIRGDWQNLLWLLRIVPDANGIRRRNAMPFFGKWMILTKLLRTLSDVTLLYLLARALSADTSLSVLLCLLIYLFLVNKAMFQLLFWLRDSTRRFTKAVDWEALRRRFTRLHEIAFLNFLQLGWHAVVALHAILLAIFRLLMGDYLLEWATAKEEENITRSTKLQTFGFLSLVLASVIGITGNLAPKHSRPWQTCLVMSLLLIGPRVSDLAIRHGDK